MKGLKVSAIMRWVGPASIAGAAFVVISDQLGLVTHLPDLGADAAGYHAVGSGLFLLILTLLLVGMFGLYARRPEPGATRVVEYGDARSRYVLMTEDDEPVAAHERPEASRAVRRGAEDVKGTYTRRHRMGQGSGEAAQPALRSPVSRSIR